MDKKGKINEFFHRLDEFTKAVKRSYLYKLVSKFLSVACSIILVLLLVVGGLMFFFNMQAKSYKEKGQEYNAPFGLYTIVSGSMEPNVSVYDVVIAVNQDISEIKVGDIITFISTWDATRGFTITHRVIDVTKNEAGEYQLYTKGDNNQTKDGGVVTQNNLVGKIVGRIPRLGKLQEFLATKTGWLIIVFIPAMAIIILDVIKILKLYVLKDQIDKVKTRKEALANALAISVENKDEETIRPTIDTLEELSNEKNNSTDAVELPRAEADTIRESGIELPLVKGRNENTDANKTLEPTSDVFNKKEIGDIAPSNTIELPILENGSDNEIEDLPKIKFVENVIHKQEEKKEVLELPTVRREPEGIKSPNTAPTTRSKLKRRQ